MSIGRGLDGEVRKQKVRVSQISSLANDLALALAAPSLRIEAPVPGQSFVGIEVPNDTIAMVGLRGVLDSNAFRQIQFAAGVCAGQGRERRVGGGGPGEYAAHLDRGHDRLGQERVHQRDRDVADRQQHAGGPAAGDDRSEDGGVDPL